MKKGFVKLFLLLVVLFSISFSASSQIYVKIRPVVPVVVRPVRPSHDHIWIDEEWEPNQGNYRYSGGHWDRPPHRGSQWRRGHWRHSREGDMWIRGSWGRGRGSY